METLICFPFTSSLHCFQHILDPLLRSSKLLEDFGLNVSSYPVSFGSHIFMITPRGNFPGKSIAYSYYCTKPDIRKEAARLSNPAALVLVYQSGYVLHSRYIFSPS